MAGEWIECALADACSSIDYGLTGPNLRGCGVNYDVRKAHPYLVYKNLEFDVPIGSVSPSLAPWESS